MLECELCNEKGGPFFLFSDLLMELCLQSSFAMGVAYMALTARRGTTPLSTASIRLFSHWMAAMIPLRLVDFSEVKLFQWSQDSMNTAKVAAQSKASEYGVQDFSESESEEEKEFDVLQDGYRVTPSVNYLFEFPGWAHDISSHLYAFPWAKIGSPQTAFECLLHSFGVSQKQGQSIAVFYWLLYPLLCMIVIALLATIATVLFPWLGNGDRSKKKARNLLVEEIGLTPGAADSVVEKLHPKDISKILQDPTAFTSNSVEHVKRLGAALFREVLVAQVTFFVWPLVQRWQRGGSEKNQMTWQNFRCCCCCCRRGVATVDVQSSPRSHSQMTENKLRDMLEMCDFTILEEALKDPTEFVDCLLDPETHDEIYCRYFLTPLAKIMAVDILHSRLHEEQKVESAHFAVVIRAIRDFDIHSAFENATNPGALARDIWGKFDDGALRAFVALLMDYCGAPEVLVNIVATLDEEGMDQLRHGVTVLFFTGDALPFLVSLVGLVGRPVLVAAIEFLLTTRAHLRDIIAAAIASNLVDSLKIEDDPSQTLTQFVETLGFFSRDPWVGYV